MSNLKEKIATELEKLSKSIAVSSACTFLWGEVEMPESLKAEVEEDEWLKIIFIGQKCKNFKKKGS